MTAASSRASSIPPTFLSRLVMKVLGVQYGDYRNWDNIDAWAEWIAGSLAPLLADRS